MNDEIGYSFEIEERQVGGWRLRLFEHARDPDGVPLKTEVGGGVFPPGDDGWCEAHAVGADWLASRVPLFLDT